MIGALVYSGHDLDHLLGTYSFDQLALMARASLGHQVKIMNMMLSPLHGMQGMGWKDHQVDKPQGPQRQRRPGEHRAADYDTAEAKDKALMQALAHAPVRVRSVKVSKDGDSG